MTEIGFSSITINPKLNTLLSGSPPLRIYKKKHSDLWLRAFLIDDGENTLFLGLDTLAIDNYFYEMIIERLVQYGINKEHVIVNATHTHSGPEGLVNTRNGILKGLNGLFGDYQNEYAQLILEKIEKVVKECLANKEKLLTYRVCRGSILGIGSERHDKRLPGDNSIVCWSFETVSNKKILFYNFSCHPTVLNGPSEYLSSDFPGEVAKILSNEYVSVNFINGNCGDISTRFSRSKDSVADIEKYGKMLAGKIKKLLDNAKSEKQIKIQLRQVSYILKANTFGNVNSAEKKLESALRNAKKTNNLTIGERRVIESYAEGAKTNLALARNFKNIKEIEIKITFLKLNNEMFVSIPGELFSSLANTLKKSLKINFFGFTNGYSLYIPDEEAYKKGYYEALSSIYKKGQGEQLMKYIECDINEWQKELSSN